MRAVADGRLAMGPGVREHLELCLDCRACESACPSGVQYGKMIEPFKIALASSATGQREDQPATTADSSSPFSVLRAGSSWRWRRHGCCSGSGFLDWAERNGLIRLLPPTLRRMQAMLPKLGGSHGQLA